jgi:NADPH:quinone reductase-like Zn-dependent oxidoreductase
MYGAGDVRVETVPDARLAEPTDAVVTVTRSAICGSDLWPYKSMEPSEEGRPMGHEFIGVVEDVGDEVRTLKAGDLVVTPFVWSDGTCVFCREGLHTSCLHGGRYGLDTDGGQGEAVRVPQADGTLVVLPVEKDDALMPSLLTLSDVMAAPSACAACWLRGAWARSRSSSWGTTRPGSRSGRTSARRTWSVSEATRLSSACRSSQTASAHTRSSSASASSSRWPRRCVSPAWAELSAA